MIGALIQAIGTAITQFATALGGGMSSLVNIFYDGTEITPVGNLVMIALGIGIVYWLFGWIRGLIHLRG